MNTTKIFETWVFSGVKFLAFPNNDGCHVVDEDGGNYGAYRSVEGFRKRQRRDPDDPLSQGAVKIRLLYLRENS